MTSNDIFLKLIDLRNQAGTNIYERLVLVDKLLADHTWVEAPDCGGGDLSVAIDRLEAECFGDLWGSWTLPQLGEILILFPKEEAWKRHKYNLRKLYGMVLEKRRPKASTRTDETTKPTSALHQQIDILQKLRAEVAQLRQQLTVVVEERNAALADNKKLRAKIKKIEALIGSEEVAT